MPTHQTEMKVIFNNPHNNPIRFILDWNQVKFDPAHRNQVGLGHPHNIQVNFHAHTKHKWLSPRVQSLSQFRPTTQQRTQFHPYAKVKSNSVPHTEIKSIWTTHTKTKPIFMLILKTGDFRPVYQ